MRDAPPMRDGQALGGRLEERERLVERAAAHPGAPALREVVGERAPLEPLEDHVRRPRAGGGGDGAEVHRANDVQRLLRQRVEELRLVLELGEQRVLDGAVLGGHDLERLDGDGLLEGDVPPAIDHAVAAFADHLVSAVLPVERGPDERERVFQIGRHSASTVAQVTVLVSLTSGVL